MKKTHGMYSVATMDATTYDKLQKCLGVDFEKETKRQQRHYRKIKSKK